MNLAWLSVSGGVLEIEAVSEDDHVAPMDGSRATPITSLEDLYHSHYQPMVRVAYLLTGSSDVARDIVQDAFAAMPPALGPRELPTSTTRSPRG